MAEHWIIIIFMVSFLLVALITALIQTYLEKQKKEKNERIQTRDVRFRDDGKQK